MPKDAKGHGSNPRGIVSVRYKVKDPTWTGTVITHGAKPVASGGQPKSSNAEAASKLASGPKSAPAPVHDAMWDDAVKKVYSPEGSKAANRRYGGVASNWSSPGKREKSR